MRRLLYVTLLLALLVPTGSAFAQADCPNTAPIEQGQWILGEIWETPDDLFGAACWETEDEVTLAPERVDAFLTRPAASYPNGWPFAWGPQGFWLDVEPWWWTGGQSEQRRISYAEDWLYATEWGGYYAEFLLPRDEVWFPCSFPNKWQCDYEVAPDVWVYHSPQVINLEPDPDDPWSTDWTVIWPPYDTISPLVIDIQDAEKQVGVQYQLEIVGYTWYFSDME